jgi:predicted transcriptional regulator
MTQARAVRQLCLGSSHHRAPLGSPRPLVVRFCVMYIHHMVRTQLYLDEKVHRRLRDLAEQQGRTVSDLVREAVARAFGAGNVDQRLTTLEGITSLWRDRRDLGDTGSYVRHRRQDTRRLPRKD